MALCIRGHFSHKYLISGNHGVFVEAQTKFSIVRVESGWISEWFQTLVYLSDFTLKSIEIITLMYFNIKFGHGHETYVSCFETVTILKSMCSSRWCFSRSCFFENLKLQCWHLYGHGSFKEFVAILAIGRFPLIVSIMCDVNLISSKFFLLPIRNKQNSCFEIYFTYFFNI